jgi:NAD(P)-dependent dehydrogenase (short-subunit alcohol dehydrogenase family)
MTSGTVIVTGSAGGIGAAICTRLSGDGYHVVGFDQVESPAADTWVPVDLADLRAVASAVETVAAEHRIVGLVHNAAVQPLWDAGATPVDKFVEAMFVNVVAVNQMVAPALESLTAERGAIVVVSSVHAVATTRGLNAYATSKAALEGWVRSASLDLAPAIRVNSVRPGAIDTAKLREGFLRWGPESAVERRAILEERTALRRVGKPEEVAAAVSFLLGPDASFITGTSIVVDGGASVRLGSE